MSSDTTETVGTLLASDVYAHDSNVESQVIQTSAAHRKDITLHRTYTMKQHIAT